MWIRKYEDNLDSQLAKTMEIKLRTVNPNIFLSYALLLYRISILIFDIFVFLLQSCLEYGRIFYRFFVPRPKRNISGEVALITGAGHGIGKQIAFELAKCGCVVVCLDIDSSKNEETVKEIRRVYRSKAYGYQCDVSDLKQVEKSVRNIENEIGNVDILINNAGVLCCRPFTQHTSEQIEKMITINLLGQLWVLKAILPGMIKRDKGSVVAMSSFAGHAGVPNMVPYTASKFGIRGMMEALYIELRQENPKHNVHLMTVSPFLVDTGMIKNRRIRFPGVLDVETAEKTAQIIVGNLRQRTANVFIPNLLYYLMSIIRTLPSRIQLLITDFMDSGIGIDYYND